MRRFGMLARIGLLALACSPVVAWDFLIIDRLVQKPGVVLYELPDTEGRAEVIRYVGSIRDAFWKGVEMMDAGAASEAALRDKCGRSCVLYTTLGEGSKVVRAATAGMGWEARDGMFRWRKVSMPLADARFIFAAKSPWSGNMVVYGAGSNRGLVEINRVQHGGASFHVFRGTRLEYEGKYEADLVPRESVTRAEALEDIEQFFATLERVHPKLLDKMSRGAYDKLRRRTVDGIGSEVAIEELASRLYFAAAQFGDGHTTVGWTSTPTEVNAAGRKFPPFRLAFDNGRYLIVAALDKSIEGGEVTAINGVPLGKFLRPILDRCSGETAVFKAVRFTSSQPFWYWLTNLFGGAESVKLTLRDGRGNTRQTTMALLDIGAYRDVLQRAAPVLAQPNRRGTEVEFLDDGKVAHFLYAGFRLSDAEKKKVADIFAQIRAKGSTDLILDLRGNGGGNSSMGDHIFSYLYDGKFSQYSASAVKISADVRQYLQGWKQAESVKDGTVVRETSVEKAVPKPAAFFAGRKYLLVDNGTFSSAADFAAMFRDYGVGTILGYETGGLAVSYGDMHGFTLKNSGIGCGVSWKQFFGPRPRKGDDQHGVLPEVPMNARVLAEFAGEADPVLAAAMKYVRGRQ